MLGIGAGVAIAEYFGVPAVRWLMVTTVVMMAIEMARYFGKINLMYRVVFILYSVLMLGAAYFVGTRPWIVLLLLVIIGAADIGAWFFGRQFGKDKMWKELSPNKTWAGQIAGIACGTLAAVMYGLLGTDTFLPQLMWIGMGVSLLAQYGDLTASWIKRKLGIKDFGNILPGHGGIIDRFDGWIYVLPIIWLVML